MTTATRKRFENILRSAFTAEQRPKHSYEFSTDTEVEFQDTGIKASVPICHLYTSFIESYNELFALKEKITRMTTAAVEQMGLDVEHDELVDQTQMLSHVFQQLIYEELYSPDVDLTYVHLSGDWNILLPTVVCLQNGIETKDVHRITNTVRQNPNDPLDFSETEGETIN